MFPQMHVGARVRIRRHLPGIGRGTVGLVDDVSGALVYVCWEGRRTRNCYAYGDAQRLFEVLGTRPCGMPSGACPHCIGERLQSRGGVSVCPLCSRRWNTDGVVPCPWPADEVIAGAIILCRSHARRLGRSSRDRGVALPLALMS
jgi:hypothetical protein